jgi:hypothetical protein
MNIINRPQRKSTFLILFFLCASVPFVAAKLALEFGWLTAGVKNKGQWLEQDIQLLAANSQALKHWQLVYVQGDSCDTQCEQALHILQQLFISLGRKQDEISLFVVAPESPVQLEHFANIKWLAPITAAAGLRNTIVIVDRQGLALLRYPIIQDSAAMLLMGKDVRTDLLHLMNYDRVGK